MADTQDAINEIRLAVNEVVEAVAHIGQALSVHLANADIDPVVTSLQNAGKHLDRAQTTLDAPVNDLPKFPGI
jgi:hypothetical protein